MNNIFLATTLKKNIMANFVGQAISFLVGLIVVPFYIKFLGIEGYGLVGFYTLLQSAFNSFLDFGFSVTINRELARYTTSSENNSRVLDLVRTMEIGYWLIGLVLAVAVCSASTLISTYWLKSETISGTTIQQVVFIMGVIIFFQWPLTLYQGGLIGLQKMVTLNALNVSLIVIRGIGGVLILWFYPMITTFFIWQLLISILQVSLTTFLLWRSLPVGDRLPRFNPGLLYGKWRFAAGMSATALLTFFADYGGKVLLSKIISLEGFGYYSLATTLNDQLRLLSSQIHNALFPQFSSLVAKGDIETLRGLYHKSNQYITILILPIIGTLTLFATELIFLWTQDINVTTNVVPIVTLLFIGTLFLELAGVPSTLTLAYGWASPNFFKALASFLFLLPLTVVASLKYQAVGVAGAWALFNLVNFILFPYFVHRRLLKTELRYWAVTDIGIPATLCLIALFVAYLAIPQTLSTVQIIFVIPVVFLLVFICTFLSARDVRGFIVDYVKKLNPL